MSVRHFATNDSLLTGCNAATCSSIDRSIKLGGNMNWLTDLCASFDQSKGWSPLAKKHSESGKRKCKDTQSIGNRCNIWTNGNWPTIRCRRTECKETKRTLEFVSSPSVSYGSKCAANSSLSLWFESRNCNECVLLPNKCDQEEMCRTFLIEIDINTVSCCLKKN